MKTQFGLIMAACCILFASEADAQFQWVKRIASTVNPNGEFASGLVLDSQCNCYVTGWFDGTNDFGGALLTSTNDGGQDIFLAKYNSSGALQWAKRAGGSSGAWDAGRGVGVDSAGNVYVTGGFSGTADFGPINLTAHGAQDFFLAKYNNAGAVQWVRQSSANGTGSSLYGTSIAVDGSGNSYAVGFYEHNNVSFGGTALPTPGDYGAFLVKYDSSGNVQWSLPLIGLGRVYSASVALDSASNPYISGSFTLDIDIGSVHLQSAGDRDAFVAKFNSGGAVQWVRQIGGLGTDTAEGGVAVDGANDVYVSGIYASNPLVIGSTSLTNSGGWDGFVAKFDSAGAPIWARRGGGSQLDAYYNVAVGENGGVYVGGTLGSDVTSPQGLGGAVVAKFDSDGALKWSASVAGRAANPVPSIIVKCAADSSGACYAIGWYQGTATFGTTQLEPAGYWNFFLAKVDGSSFGIWKSVAFPDAADRNDPIISDELATPANDGITNLMKYALSLAPKVSAVDKMPTTGSIRINGANYLTLAFRRNKSATDVIYSVEATDSIESSSWTSVTTPVSQIDFGDHTLITIRDNIPMAGHPRRFMRLCVVKP